MSLSAFLRRVPVPIFGNANLAIQFTSKIVRKAPNYAGWLVPLGIGGTWFIWPAVSDESKVFLGLLPDPEAEKLAAEALELANAEKHIDLTEEDIEKHLRRLRGDYSDLHTQWERSTVASLMMLDDEEEVDEEEEEDDEDDDEEDDEEGGDEEGGDEEGGEEKGGDDDDEEDDDDED
eukprot:CAMPEP_0194376652 /NCGR_PEP_ID=MMETSP0174-20130528/26686_1 /TAXON_ID=216777 /ORGANISM="Proboscia alata, Strain PI-D3" /LENGTH=176 /DNA_ID=CAMNT_0039157437 /DNA_START=56 /DNA_END=586 /DNA_ORIENTATION=+